MNKVTIFRCTISIVLFSFGLYILHDAFDPMFADIKDMGILFAFLEFALSASIWLIPADV